MGKRARDKVRMLREREPLTFTAGEIDEVAVKFVGSLPDVATSPAAEAHRREQLEALTAQVATITLADPEGTTDRIVAAVATTEPLGPLADDLAALAGDLAEAGCPAGEVSSLRALADHGRALEVFRVGGATGGALGVLDPGELTEAVEAARAMMVAFLADGRAEVVRLLKVRDGLAPAER
jgi:hypothetical protein